MGKMKITDIKIGTRYRKDLGDIESLAKNIEEFGLLHPIVVTPSKTGNTFADSAGVKGEARDKVACFAEHPPVNSVVDWENKENPFK